jgi:hypothetical protein
MTPREHNDWTEKLKRYGGNTPLVITEAVFYKIIELGEYDKYKNSFIISK